MLNYLKSRVSFPNAVCARILPLHFLLFVFLFTFLSTSASVFPLLVRFCRKEKTKSEDGGELLTDTRSLRWTHRPHPAQSRYATALVCIFPPFPLCGTLKRATAHSDCAFQAISPKSLLMFCFTSYLLNIAAWFIARFSHLQKKRWKGRTLKRSSNLSLSLCDRTSSSPSKT